MLRLLVYLNAENMGWDPVQRSDEIQCAPDFLVYIKALQWIHISISESHKTDKEFINPELILELNGPEKFKNPLNREVYCSYSCFDEDAKLLIRLLIDW